MVQQVVLITIFIGLMALGALSVDFLLACLIQIVCFGFDFMSQKMVSMLSKGEDK